MKEEEFKIAGYRFTDANEYKQAKSDVETIEFVKANTNINDLSKAIKLYNKLIERKTFKTVVGYAFLKELQERIVEGGLISRESIPCIQVEKNEKKIKIYSEDAERSQEQKHLNVIEDYKIKIRNSRIISGFLAVIIIAMILISIFSDRNIFSNYEDKIIDKYSAWEEELNSREQALDAQEEIEKNN